jgi:predicted Zn-dependent protease
MSTSVVQTARMGISIFLLSALPAFAQTQTGAAGGSLSEKDNPLLTGKRNINKGQIDFYSLDKDVALGRQFAAEVDHQSKFVEDPLTVEYVNRVGQNIVMHSEISDGRAEPAFI